MFILHWGLSALNMAFLGVHIHCITNVLVISMSYDFCSGFLVVLWPRVGPSQFISFVMRFTRRSNLLLHSRPRVGVVKWGHAHPHWTTTCKDSEVCTRVMKIRTVAYLVVDPFPISNPSHVLLMNLQPIFHCPLFRSKCTAVCPSPWCFRG